MSKFGLKDSLFIRGEVPMTKSEVRAITISKLQLQPNDVVVDIGAGSGSITVECALTCELGTVYAIEKKVKAINILRQNIKKFKLKNCTLIEGEAPSNLPQVDINKAFIGGSGGQLVSIFNWLKNNLYSQGIVVANCISLENTINIINLFKQYHYDNIDITQVSIAKGKPIAELTLMMAQNPIYIISAQKQ